LAGLLGLSRVDSVPGLVRRLESRLTEAPELACDVDRIERRLSTGAVAMEAGGHGQSSG